MAREKDDPESKQYHIVKGQAAVSDCRISFGLRKSESRFSNIDEAVTS
jgi:hypothetical protein